MNILFIAGRELLYPRNTLMLEAMRGLGITQILPQPRSSSLIIRSFQLSLSALPHLFSRKYDLVFVGFFGHFLMLPLGLLSRRPIIFDAFISVYDTLCFDRRRFASGSLFGRLALWIDQASCRLADRILLDTQAQVAYFRDVLSVSNSKLRSVFVGADESIFYPRDRENATPIVLFYGSLLPLHGIEFIIQAAELLKDQLPVRFKIIGSGAGLPAVRRIIKDHKVTNVDLLDPVPLEILPEQIAGAEICLGGHFGVSDKASRVIAGKTFQCLAMGKPTIVGQNSANSELLTHGRDAWFCQMGNPTALADAIATLMADKNLRLTLGAQAYHTFHERACFKVLIPQIQKIALELL